MIRYLIRSNKSEFLLYNFLLILPLMGIVKNIFVLDGFDIIINIMLTLVISLIIIGFNQVVFFKEITITKNNIKLVYLPFWNKSISISQINDISIRRYPSYRRIGKSEFLEICDTNNKIKIRTENIKDLNHLLALLKRINNGKDVNLEEYSLF